MRRLTIILSSLLFFAASVYAQGQQSLNSLWKTYESYQKSDKPKQSLATLSEIINLAFTQKETDDFIDACEKNIKDHQSINWKNRDSVITAMSALVDKYDSPLATFWFRRNFERNTFNVEEFVRQHQDALKSQSNRQLYEKITNSETISRLSAGIITNDNSFAGSESIFLNACENDYEFVLWQMGGYQLDSMFAGRAPADVLLELLRLDSSDTLALRAYSEKYAGRSVSILAEERILNLEFQGMNNDDDYRTFRQKCLDMKKKRLYYRSHGRDRSEKSIATFNKTDEILLDEYLDDRQCYFNVSDGILEMYMKNTGKARVTISNEKNKVASFTVCDSLCRYYVTDTVRVPLPDLEDGEYAISAGREYSDIYLRYSLSVATRRDADGVSIYVADSRTGKPLDMVDVTIYENDEVFKEMKEMKLNGFTRLPSEVLSSNRELICSYRDSRGKYRRSDRINLMSGTTVRTTGSFNKNPQGLLLLNSSILNPGDSVRFKAILYRQKDAKSYETLASGEKVEIYFLDPDGKQFASADLLTNDFGSVAGAFSTSCLEKLGRCSIVARMGRRQVANEIFTVSDVILPSFDLAFDDLEQIPIAGDTVIQTGRLTSFSGHGLGGCSASYCINGSDFQSLDIARDGSFSIDVPLATDAWYYNIIVRVVDPTGQTREFPTGYSTRHELGLNLAPDYSSFSVCRDSEGNNLSVVEREIFEVKYILGGMRNNTLYGAELTWQLYDGGKEVLSGKAEDGKALEIDMTGLPQTVFTLKAGVVYGNHKCKGEFKFLLVRDGDTFLVPGISSFAKMKDGKNPGLMIGSSDSPLWACVSLFGSDNRLLLSQMVNVTNQRSLLNLDFEYVPGYPDKVMLDVFWFKAGKSGHLQKTYVRKFQTMELPLKFERFRDTALPSSKCCIGIKTASLSECAVTVFDKSTELFSSNGWNHTLVRNLSEVPSPYINYNQKCGRNGLGISENGLKLYMKGASKLSMSSAPMESRSAVMANAVRADALVEEESIPFQVAETSAEFGGTPVRENFASAIAFEPFLRSDADGNVDLEFETSDRLSTFIVQAYVHDKSMHSSTIRREMVVSIPVKIDLVPPKYLYRGDGYVANGSLSSTASANVAGTVTMTFFEGRGKVIGKYSSRVVIPSGGQTSFSFKAPQTDADTLGIKVIFMAEDNSFSDGLFVTVPVCEPVQTLTEAHSAVLLSGMSYEKLLKELRGRFVNTSSYGAEYQEISILDMVKDAIPESVQPSSDNVISLTESLFSGRLAAQLAGRECEDASVVNRIVLCRNADGGFAWFSRMSSSPLITAAVLYRFAKLRDRGLLPDKELTDLLPGAVTYLDKAFFGKEIPFWRGGISMEKYMLVRSMYPEVPFTEKTPSGFGKTAREYLFDNNLQGQIAAKAVRILTLRNLISSEEGETLAKAWGTGLGTVSKVRSSLEADLASLAEYAVAHKDGGVYYPNAVMPFCGLMEGEIFAHTILCDLWKGTDDRLADGIRVWMMLQKETQQWGDDPAFVEAISSILEASPEALASKVILMKKKYVSEFSKIKEAGNGFTIGVKWLRESFSDGKKKLEEIADGAALKVGDKIVAHYELWSEENRSFVRVRAPRPASFRPVQELSGWNGWCYRNVLSSETEYWFDAFPEEHSTREEAFFVTQEGVFNTPSLEIESIYAPHYRANSSYKGTVKSTK